MSAARFAFQVLDGLMVLTKGCICLQTSFPIAFLPPHGILLLAANADSNEKNSHGIKTAKRQSQ